MASRAVTVFCGSRSGQDPKWAKIARECGKELVRRDFALVFGGGGDGLMGEIARAVIEANGTSVGIIPEGLLAIEPAEKNVTELLVVDSMHTRKRCMSQRADAFLVLPGGIGTFEEFFECWTWHQIGLHHKPIALLNAHNYYSPLLTFLDQGLREGFIRPDHHRFVQVVSTVQEAFDYLDQACSAPSKPS